MSCSEKYSALDWETFCFSMSSSSWKGQLMFPSSSVVAPQQFVWGSAGTEHATLYSSLARREEGRVVGLGPRLIWHLLFPKVYSFQAMLGHVNSKYFLLWLPSVLMLFMISFLSIIVIIVTTTAIIVIVTSGKPDSGSVCLYWMWSVVAEFLITFLLSCVRTEST